ARAARCDAGARRPSQPVRLLWDLLRLRRLLPSCFWLLVADAIFARGVYCGIPAGLDAFKVAHAVLVAEGAIATKK
ncbi:MAG TPA: hypothetical protein VNU71_21235, partial [Burkholderiaceae bacterium]|nr:hypothetical protein [Burkholderiaceae bacterium]